MDEPSMDEPATGEPRRYRVGVLFGGRSGEHEVSLASARNVMEALSQAGHTVIPLGIDRSGRWLVQGDPWARLTDASQQPVNGQPLARSGDPAALLPLAEAQAALPPLDIVFPVLHGPFGEDGTVQGLLEMADLPYVGSGVLASALGMDKGASKLVFQAVGLPQARYRAFLRRRWRQEQATVLESLEEALAYPMFVKPANLGSSVGISKARDRAELVQAIELACEYDRKIVVEEAVPGAREIEVSVLGNDEPQASVPGEIVPGNEFYDYAAKYLDDNSQLLIPAPIGPELTRQVQALAVRAFQALDCAGLARVDFLLSEGGELFLNEVNTMPGFTRISMYPKLWEASGIGYPELVDRLLQLGFERYQERQENRVTR